MRFSQDRPGRQRTTQDLFFPGFLKISLDEHGATARAVLGAKSEKELRERYQNKHRTTTRAIRDAQSDERVA